MRSNPSVVVAGIAAGALGLGTWVALPWLQSSARKTETSAAVHVERARRLLSQYSGDLAYRALLVEQLRDRDVDVDVTDAADLAEEATDAYQQQHEALWTAFEPKDWERHELGDPQPPRAAKAAYGNIAGQIRDGIKGRTNVAKENETLLKDAMAEIDEALSAEGAAEGAILFEANRLKGVIQYHRGLAERVRATLARAEAGAYRRRLAELGSGALQWSTSRTLVAESGVDGHIESLKAEIAKAESRLSQEQKELSALDGKIKGLEDRIAAAKARAEQARTELDNLKNVGVDFSDPQGGETFATKVGEHDTVYREAIRQVQALEAGDLPKAEIDASGDFYRGRYLENGSPTNLTPEPGLSHHRVERAALATTVDGRQQSVKDLRAALVRLEGIRGANAVAQEDAVGRIDAAGPAATEAYEKLNRLESEAMTMEDGALKLLDGAVSSFQQAAGAVDRWVSSARERTQNLAPGTKERSASNARENDEWLAGHISAQIADARLAKAWTYYERFSTANENADVLTAAAKSLKLAEADPSAERAKADEARAKGVDEINKAMEVLKKAHNQAEKHWTITAQGAGTMYLLVLFGESDYVADAAEAYRLALMGRDNESYAAPFAARLKRLQSRSSDTP